MSIREKHIARHYTLVEVMMAMGIFLIMMTIMMQFFTSAQEVWNNSSKRNMIYADARVAMNLMTREIQSVLYNNDDNGVSGIYPFWYEWITINETSLYDSGGSVPAPVETYFLSNNDLSPQTGGTDSGRAYLTALNFISATDLKSVEKGSDVCEIRYKFIPVYSVGTPNSANDIKGGILKRSCTGEYRTSTNLNTTGAGGYYNFADNPYSGAPQASRLTAIWSASSSEDFKTVINGVYALSFYCYKWDSGLAYHYPMNTSGMGINGNTTYADYSYGLGNGTPLPVAIRIDMKLMDPKDLKRLAYNIYIAGTATGSERTEAEEEVKVLERKIRSFSKVIYLGKRED
jgi:type II secretory pathway pseudopilin PulG